MYSIMSVFQYDHLAADPPASTTNKLIVCFTNIALVFACFHGRSLYIDLSLPYNRWFFAVDIYVSAFVVIASSAAVAVAACRSALLVSLWMLLCLLCLLCGCCCCWLVVVVV